ncbi:hypothetical protein PAXRUDRAFT_9550 [Paxillus rubicundulus Ve08.2h10]|uniref:Uncharacterized protein n=1 Tax=Paxillus rubicundulus Ve08.2h10 TaxID=930991 RepID=A0A0D0E8E4_9AGAM|nr:hypothetical protein PAXRUDRAFT_9550 [Paxillus rubicundulus Ve08.2h10]
MADPNLETIPNYAGPEFDIIWEGFRCGYHEDDQQAIERLLAAWQADRATRITAWNTWKEAEARAAKEVEEMCRACEEEEEAAANKEAVHEWREEEKKRLKMNTFTPGLSIADVLIHPPSQASRNVLPDHELSFSEFLKAKNCFLDYAKKTNWPVINLNALVKFFWFLETHPSLQIPLREKIILTYTSRVCFDWHRELKAGRGYNISVINSRLLDTITQDIEGRQIQGKYLPSVLSLVRSNPTFPPPCFSSSSTLNPPS